jgi:hypothetical protein
LQVRPVPASRAVCRSRAATIRGRNSADGGASWLRNASADGRETVTETSIRSSSGPLSRRWWRARSALLQRHDGSAIPHGQGFEAATSVTRVGNTITRCARTIVT